MTHPDEYLRKDSEDSRAWDRMVPIARGYFVSEGAMRALGLAPLPLARPGSFCGKLA